MKLSTGTIKQLLVPLLWSMFVGIVGISIGLGSLVPAINDVAKPIVCADGEILHDQQVVQDTVTRTSYSADYRCSEPGSGPAAAREVHTINPIPYAGPFFGLVCFGLFLLGRRFFKGKLPGGERLARWMS